MKSDNKNQLKDEIKREIISSGTEINKEEILKAIKESNNNINNNNNTPKSNLVTVKDIKSISKNAIELGIIWFGIIAIINKINLTTRQLQLLSFINYRGTISSTSAKAEFVKMFNSSTATISNMISELSESKILVKEKGKIKITPSLRIDTDKELVIRISLSNFEILKKKNNNINNS